MEKAITVFTPTFNRAHLLGRLFESLAKQSYQNFEWIIVDDGSTDNTTEVVEEFKRKSPVDIHYFQQNNQGKHVAINRGVAEAAGELFFIVDSDDFLPENALDVLLYNFNRVRSEKTIAAVSGKRNILNQNGGSVSLKNREEVLTPFEFRFVKKYVGDMAEAFKTEVLKEYPFPIFKGEKFCTESVVWNRIGRKYKVLYFDEYIYHCEYQDDGLTSKYWDLLLENPKGSLLYFKELLKFNLNSTQRRSTVKAYNTIAKRNGFTSFKVLKELGLRDFLRVYV